MKSKSEIVRDLKAKVPLFAGFSEERLGELVDASAVTSFEANEVIAYYGAEATHLNVVLEGVATASVPDPDGGSRILARFEAGGTFGEMALMTGDAMVADVVAGSPCEVLRIPVPVFQSIVVAHPGPSSTSPARSRSVSKR